MTGRSVNPDLRVVLRAGAGDVADETRSLLRIGHVIDVHRTAAAFIAATALGKAVTGVVPVEDHTRLLLPGGGDDGAFRAEGTLRVFALQAPPSDELLVAARTAFAQEPAVESAHSFEGELGRGPRHLFLGLRLRDGAASAAEVLPRISQALRPALPPDSMLDVVELSAAQLEVVEVTGHRVWPADDPAAPGGSRPRRMNDDI